MNLTPIKNQLWQRRQDIAALWQASLTEFEHTYPSSVSQFTKLVEDFITALFETPVDEDKVSALGANFVQTHHVHLDVLMRTQTILLQELTAELCPEDIKAVQPRLVQVYNHFFAGYGEFAYTNLINSQAKEIERLVTGKERVMLSALHQEESWLFLVEQVSNPIIFHDGTHILDANAATHTLLDSPSQPLTGTPILALFATWAQKSLESVLQTRMLTNYETAVLTAQDIPASISFQNIPLHYQQQDAFALIIDTYSKKNQQSEPTPDPIFLTSRETQILQLMATDHNDKSIADTLGIEPPTVKFHFQNAKEKLNVSSRAATIHKAWQYNLLTEE